VGLAVAVVLEADGVLPVEEIQAPDPLARTGNDGDLLAEAVDVVFVQSRFDLAFAWALRKVVDEANRRPCGGDTRRPAALREGLYQQRMRDEATVCQLISHNYSLIKPMPAGDIDGGELRGRDGDAAPRPRELGLACIGTKPIDHAGKWSIGATLDLRLKSVALVHLREPPHCSGGTPDKYAP